MTNLSHENFLRAKEYILTHGDDINKAWFRYNFEGEDSAAFMDVLAKYQQPDGGFGGIVYEFAYQGSCLKCTEHAFRYIFFLKDKPSAEHPVIQKMMQYVLSKYHPDRGDFGHMEEPALNDEPHVRWWEYSPDDCPSFDNDDERIRYYSPNGQASIAAFVALYSELVPEDLYCDIIKYPVEKILRYYDKSSPLYGQGSVDDSHPLDDQSPYNLKCYQQFVACLKDKPLAKKLTAILRQNPTACMQLEFNMWENGYEELPCDIVNTPDSIVYPAVKELVDSSLDYLIRQQGKDGAWRLSWRLGEGEAFEKMQALYEMHLTNLIITELNRFRRIDIWP
jgi:hypothetical protein